MKKQSEVNSIEKLWNEWWNDLKSFTQKAFFHLEMMISEENKTLNHKLGEQLMISKQATSIGTS